MQPTDSDSRQSSSHVEEPALTEQESNANSETLEPTADSDSDESATEQSETDEEGTDDRQERPEQSTDEGTEVKDEFDLARIKTPHQLRVYRRMPGYRYKIPAMQRWKRTAHSLILWLRLYRYHSSQVREILRLFSDSDLLADALEESNFEELLFSVQNFKPNKQARVNVKTLSILRINPSDRSNHDLRPIEAGLRGYESFRKYPPAMLRRIAEKAWFQEFERHSVIVREGDRPMYYYFIIYGSALVSIIDREKMSARVAAILNRGDSFGELAIINRTKRASTVIARERCGLLLMEDRDYLEIFMQGGVKFLDNPFVKNHILFRGFDLNVLKANPGLVKLNYFSPGVMIVEDSRLSFWIFLVISGKAMVKMAVRRTILAQQEETAVDPDERERQQLLDEYRGGGIGHQTLIRRNWRRHLLRRDRLARRPEFQGILELRQLGLARQGGLRRELSRVGRETSTNGGGATAVTLPPLTKAHMVAPNGLDDSLQQQQVERQQSPKDGQSPKRQKITYVTGKDAVIGKRTLATDLNREYYEQVEMKLLLGEFEEQSLFEYLPVQMLERGMLFGFADHFFENQPTLKLESRGCELLCIRRELYFENADELILYNVGNSLRPYPSETAVLDKNKEVRNWKSVRGQQYEQTMTELARKAVDVHDAYSRFPKISKKQRCP